jgi:hypothetical protein
MATTTARNGSIQHPIRGQAFEMWAAFNSAKTDIDAAALAKLCEKKDWKMPLARFHLREWKIFAGKVAPREVKAAPAEKPAKATPAKKAAPAKKTKAKVEAAA